MPKAQPTPWRLQQTVIRQINWLAGPLAQQHVTAAQSLSVIFGLSGPQRFALAAPFESTAREWKGDAQVTGTACESLVTVGEAVSLVSKIAGFDGSWVVEAST